MTSISSPMHAVNFVAKTLSSHSRHGRFLSLLLLLSPMVAPAQGTPPSWVRAFGSSGTGNNISNAIKVGPDQNLYITGQFSATAGFGGTSITAAGGLDIFVAKYSPSGSLLWIAQAGGAQDDIGYGLDLDSNGNVYLTGQFTGSATFHSANSSGKTITPSGGEPNQQQIFIAKYNSTGTLQWVQTGIVDVGTNVGFGIAVNGATGTLYMAAVSQSFVTLSSASGTEHVVPGDNAWHMVLAKYDTDGNFKWAQTNAASPNSIPYSVAIDAADNVYVAGWLENSTTFASADGHSITVVGFSPGQSTGDFPDDAFLAKYDKNGNLKWVNHIGGYKAIGTAVAIGPDGQITLVGFIGNINNGSPSEASTVVTSQPPGANINLGGGTITNPYNRDEVIATYTPAGVLVRAARRGGTSNEMATGLAYDSRDNLYVAALSDVSPQSKLLVDQYSSNNLIWEAKANAGIPQGQFFAPGVAVDAAGSAFVSDGYAGTASFGNITLNGTGAEAFVAELNSAYANQSADLLLRLSASPTTVHQGDLLTFTYQVWNRGPDVAYLESLKTQVPQGTTFDYIRISGTPALGTCVTPSYGGTGPITCDENSAMAQNTTWTLRLTVKVTAPKGTVILATGTATEITPDPQPGDGTATVSFIVQ